MEFINNSLTAPTNSYLVVVESKQFYSQEWYQSHSSFTGTKFINYKGNDSQRHLQSIISRSNHVYNILLNFRTV